MKQTIEIENKNLLDFFTPSDRKSYHNEETLKEYPQWRFTTGDVEKRTCKECPKSFQVAIGLWGNGFDLPFMKPHLETHGWIAIGEHDNAWIRFIGKQNNRKKNN